MKLKIRVVYEGVMKQRHERENSLRNICISFQNLPQFFDTFGDVGSPVEKHLLLENSF